MSEKKEPAKLTSSLCGGHKNCQSIRGLNPVVGNMWDSVLWWVNNHLVIKMTEPDSSLRPVCYLTRS